VSRRLGRLPDLPHTVRGEAPAPDGWARDLCTLHRGPHPRAMRRQKNTTPVVFGVCDACAVAGARRDKHSDPVSPRLQPASFVRPSSPARSTPRGRTSAGQHRPVCKQTGPFWMPARIAREGHERGREGSSKGTLETRTTEGGRETGRLASSPAEIVVRYRLHSTACSGSWRSPLPE
jgi:hypothetical protein